MTAQHTASGPAGPDGPPLVGVLGGYGAVGTAAIEHLAASADPDVRLRVGGRDPRRATALAARFGGEALAVDVHDPAQLDAFVSGCALVLNCAGPAADIGDTVARAASRAGVDYVDAAGDDELYRSVAALPWSGRHAVISAGMMPGLTGVLPRLLFGHLMAARASRNAPLRLTGWVGGRDHFTVNAALDFLASAEQFGAAGMAWRDGRAVPHPEAARRDVAVPFFPGPVATTVFLSTETTRLAASLRLTDAVWHSVFDGPHLWQALRQPEGDTATRARRMCEAAALDLFAARPYQSVVVELASPETARTLVLHATGASRLTGLVAALTARAVLRGDAPSGVHHAADVLDPQWTVTQLRTSPDVPALDIFDGVAQQLAVVEEGVL